MIFQDGGWLETVSIFIGIIVGFIKPFLTPIGEVMVIWVDFLMQFFPTESLTFYFVVFGVLIISALIINIKWSGEYLIDLERDDEEEDRPKSEDLDLKDSKK